MKQFLYKFKILKCIDIAIKKANPKINKTTIFRPMFVDYSGIFLKNSKETKIVCFLSFAFVLIPYCAWKGKRHHKKGRK